VPLRLVGGVDNGLLRDGGVGHGDVVVDLSNLVDTHR
jgi:hypothetical protein